MSHRRAAAVVLLLVGLGCSSSPGGGDLEAFCREMAALRRNDPFADFTVASPAEMREAFVELHRGATRVAGAAVTEVEVQAARYRAAIESLMDVLAPAGYDPARLDGLAYNDVADRYRHAATVLDNGARAVCDDGS